MLASIDRFHAEAVPRAARPEWAHVLLHMLNQQPLCPPHAQIRNDGLNRVYLPTLLAQDRFIPQHEPRERLARGLQQGQGQLAANTPPPSGMWPPPP
jgi:hypothetical protein